MILCQFLGSSQLLSSPQQTLTLKAVNKNLIFFFFGATLISYFNKHLITSLPVTLFAMLRENFK